MIVWKRENVFKILCLFGDNLEHPWMEVINLGTRLFLDSPVNGFKTHQAKFEAFFAKAVNNGLVDVIDTPEVRRLRDIEKPVSGHYTTPMISKEDFNYKLSKKGDKMLRQEQAERTGDSFFFNLYDRGVDTPFGVDKFAPLPKNLKKVDNGSK